MRRVRNWSKLVAALVSESILWCLIFGGRSGWVGLFVSVSLSWSLLGFVIAVQIQVIGALNRLTFPCELWTFSQFSKSNSQSLSKLTAQLDSKSKLKVLSNSNLQLKSNSQLKESSELQLKPIADLQVQFPTEKPQNRPTLLLNSSQKPWDPIKKPHEWSVDINWLLIPPT